MSYALLVIGIVAALGAWHVHHPVRRPGELAAALFMAAWLGGELPVHAAALFAALGVLLLSLGALAEPVGWVGLALLVIAGLGPIASWRQASRARDQLSKAVGQPVAPRLSFWRYLVPLHFGDREVWRTTDVVHIDHRLTADLYRPRTPPPSPRRLLVYVHGGGWVLGFRRFQGRLLIRRMVRAGWVAVSIRYRLSPRATWPDHIVDVKRALAWVRRMAPGWNADPDRIALSGNSAGGHLASLAAFSPEVKAWQPGFEAEATHVHALVAWYGIYDLVAAVNPASTSGTWNHGALRRLWRILVMKRPFAAATDDYIRASPLTHFGEHAPPTLLIHGELDTLVPVSSARAFARTCADALDTRVTYLEVPGAEHAFDVFTSRRGAFAVEAAALWLERTLPDAAKKKAERDEAPGPT